MTAVSFFGNSVLVCGTDVGTLSFWNFQNRRCMHKETGAHGQSSILCLSSTPCIKADTLLSQGRDGIINFWRTRVDKSATVSKKSFCLEKVYTLKSCCQSYGRLHVHSLSENRYMVAVPAEDDTKFWSHRIEYDIPGAPVSVTESILISNVDDGSKKSLSGMVMSICIIDASHVIVGFESGDVSMFGIRNKVEMHRASAHADSALCVCFSPYNFATATDKNSEISGGDGGVPSLVNMAKYRGFSGGVDDNVVVYECYVPLGFGKGTADDSHFSTIKRIKIPSPGISQIRINVQEFAIAAFSGWDAIVRVYDFHHLIPLVNLEFHSGTVNDLAFLTDDSSFSAGQNDDKKPPEESGKSVHHPRKHLVSVSRDGRAACWTLKF